MTRQSCLFLVLSRDCTPCSHVHVVCMFFGLQHNSKRKSDANATQNRKNSGSVYWVLKKLLWFCVLCISLQFHPHSSNFGLAELLLHISQLLLVATQPIGEACSKSLPNWSPSDRKWFQNSFFDIQCQFPSSRSSKSSKLLRSARSAPSSCLSSWRRACKACSSLTHSTTKLATWWSRGSENLSQTSQTDMKSTNRWELRIWQCTNRVLCEGETQLLQVWKGLLDTRRTVSLSKDPMEKQSLISIPPEPPRAHYPSPGTAAGSNLPTPDSKTRRKDREVLKDVGKVYNLILRFLFSGMIPHIQQQMPQQPHWTVEGCTPTPRGTDKTCLFQYSSHLCCPSSCRDTPRQLQRSLCCTYPSSRHNTSILSLAALAELHPPSKTPQLIKQLFSNPSPTTAGGPPMGGRIWECRSHFQPEAMTCNSSASCQVPGEESQPLRARSRIGWQDVTKIYKDVKKVTKLHKGDKDEWQRWQPHFASGHRSSGAKSGFSSRQLEAKTWDENIPNRNGHQRLGDSKYWGWPYMKQTSKAF